MSSRQRSDTPSLARWVVACLLAAAAFYLGTLTGCAYARETRPTEHTPCVLGNAYDPSMHRWTLECLNSPDSGEGKPSG